MINIWCISQTLSLRYALEHLGSSVLSHPQNFFKRLPLQNLTFDLRPSSLSHSYSFFRPQFSYHCLQKISLVPQIWARCPARLPTPTPRPPSQSLPHFIVIVFYLDAFSNLLWTPGGQGLYLSCSFKIVSIDPKVNNSKNVMKVILNFIDIVVHGSSISSNFN